MPCDLEAERRLVGALLLNPARLSGVLAHVGEVDFFDPRLAATFGALDGLREDGIEIDVVAIGSRLSYERKEALFRASDGFRAFAVGLMDDEAQLAAVLADTGASHLEQWAQEIARCSAARARIALLERAYVAAKQGDQAGEESALAEMASARRTSARLLLTPIREFLGDEEAEEEPDPWLVESLLPPGVPCFLAGEPKAKKTWLAMTAAVAVAAGVPLFRRFQVAQGPAVIVAEEDTHREVRKRLWWLARGMGVDPRDLPLRVAAARGLRLDDAGAVAALEAECQGASLVVLDALARLHGADENDRTAMRAVTCVLQRLAFTTGACVLTIHHFRKKGQNDGEIRAGQRMRGSSDLHALARAVVGVEAKGDAIHLYPESNYGEPTEPFAVEFSVGQRADGKRIASFGYTGTVGESDHATAEAKVLAALRDAREPLSGRALREAIGGKHGPVDDALHRLLARAQVQPVPTVLLDAAGRRKPVTGYRVSM